MIYLDSSATTFQKPPEVAAAVAEAFAAMSSPGRGGYESAMKAAETLFQCRTELAELFHVSDPARVVFTMNATHGLNIAIKSLVRPGGTAVISGYEHNAVTRPLEALGAEVFVAAAPLFRPEEVLEAFEGMIRPGMDAVICNHVSNVFGMVQPIEGIGKLCRERGVPLVVDASQSAGIVYLDMEELGAAFVAMPGHKGLYGPQGTGVLLCGGENLPETLIEGGTGSLSLRQQMPDFLPDRLEAGTHNVPGIAGLLAGVRYVRGRGVEQICQKERLLALRLAEQLEKIPSVRVFASPGMAGQVGVVSFTVEGWDCEEIAAFLGEHGFAVRAGLHCAPLAHRSGGTLHCGTVRVSFSDFSTEEEVDLFASALWTLLRDNSE